MSTSECEEVVARAYDVRCLQCRCKADRSFIPTWPEPRSGHIVHRVDVLLELLFGDLLRRSIERLRRRRADRRMSSGRLDCALKVISGSQRGLSRRWMHVAATVSPGRLDARGHWWRLFRRIPAVSVAGVTSAARLPAASEHWSLASDCRVVEIQTPTATLAWAVLGHNLPDAVERLQPAAVPAPGFES